MGILPSSGDGSCVAVGIGLQIRLVSMGQQAQPFPIHHAHLAQRVIVVGGEQEGIGPVGVSVAVRFKHREPPALESLKNPRYPPLQNSSQLSVVSWSGTAMATISATSPRVIRMRCTKSTLNALSQPGVFNSASMCSSLNWWL